MAISVYEQLNSMGLQVNRATLQQVSESILKRAAQKNSQYNNTAPAQNFFQPRDLGVDLYNGKIDLDTAKQIALNNSGLQIQLSQDTLSKINYLNSAAAQNTQKNVDGKLTIPVNEITITERSTPIISSNRIVSLETSKDKNGSNPFYHGELLMTGKEKSKEDVIDEKQAITTSIFV